MAIKSIGFPRIKNYAGDVRDFLPSLFGYLKFEDLEIFVEETYGSGLGEEEDYLKKMIKFSSFLQRPCTEGLDRYFENARTFGAGKTKRRVQFVHHVPLPTRPAYVELFKRKNIFSLSMDGIEDDYGKRLFVDYFRTAFNGSKIAFEELKKSYKIFTQWTDSHLHNRIGSWNVAQNCAKSFEILSDEAFLEKGIPGVIVQLCPEPLQAMKQ